MAPATIPAPRSYAALPLGWAALLLYLTLAPADKLPPQPQWQLLSFDTFAHAAFFAVQAALAWFSLRRQRRWPALARHAGWAVLLGCTAFGAIIEGLQMALPFNRHGEWSDLISDSLGTAVALGLCYATAPALRRWGWVLGLLGVSLASSVQAQDMPRVRKTIEALASPRMHGRGYVQAGDKIAAAYLREQLKRLKLQPLPTDYTQLFVLDVNTFPDKLSFELASKHPVLRKSIKYKPGRDYIAVEGSRGGAWHSLPLIWLDTLNPAKPELSDWLLRISLFDKALMLSGRTAGLLSKMPQPLRQHIDSAALWVKCVPKLTASIAASQSKRGEIELLTPTVYRKSVPGTLDCGMDVPAFPDAFVDVVIDAQLRRNYQTQNLAAIVRGSAQPDSFLVVSAHYDHLGMMGKSVYFPGANDNASGVAMLLELAAHYAKPGNRPACSVVFLLFGAEEAGLVGSQYFVAHPLVPLKNIKFLMNLDLLGSGEQGATVVNGRLHENAFRRLTAINDVHHYLPALGARGKAANSDHYPFSEAGVPAFYMYLRGASTAYHDVNDKPATLTLAGFPGAFGLVRDFLNELGARPGR
jgi:aminopeptidase YwaD